jgi:hypothetical protein
MKTKNLFRTAAIAMLSAATFSAFAQVTTSGNATATKATLHEGIEFATISSVMPYIIDRDANVAAMVASDPATFQPSEFNWRLPAGGAIAKLGGGAWTPGTTAGYYLDTASQVSWGAVAGIYNITVSEKTRNSGGLSTCSGADSSISVYLMSKPTAAFVEASSSLPGTNTSDAKLGGCSTAGTTINLAVAFTGAQDFRVVASSVYTPIGGVAQAPVSIGSTVTNLGTSTFFSATPTVPNSETVNTAMSFAIPASGAGAYGKYVITLTAVSDLVSRKSYKDNDLVTPGYQGDNGDLSAGVQTLTVYSLPTPVTGTVKHVTNLGW